MFQKQYSSNDRKNLENKCCKLHSVDFVLKANLSPRKDHKFSVVLLKLFRRVCLKIRWHLLNHLKHRSLLTFRRFCRRIISVYGFPCSVDERPNKLHWLEQSHQGGPFSLLRRHRVAEAKRQNPFRQPIPYFASHYLLGRCYPLCSYRYQPAYWWRWCRCQGGCSECVRSLSRQLQTPRRRLDRCPSHRRGRSQSGTSSRRVCWSACHSVSTCAHAR